MISMHHNSTNLIIIESLSGKFDKTELDFFLYEECVKGNRFMLIGEYVVEWYLNHHLGTGGFLFEYLKANPIELVYAIQCGAIDEDVLKEYEIPQSEFFKKMNITNEDKMVRRLAKIKQIK